jgi:hypothetical protein
MLRQNSAVVHGGLDVLIDWRLSSHLARFLSALFRRGEDASPPQAGRLCSEFK